VGAVGEEALEAGFGDLTEARLAGVEVGVAGGDQELDEDEHVGEDAVAVARALVAEAAGVGAPGEVAAAVFDAVLHHFAPVVAAAGLAPEQRADRGADGLAPVHIAAAPVGAVVAITAVV